MILVWKLIAEDFTITLNKKKTVLPASTTATLSSISFRDNHWLKRCEVFVRFKIFHFDFPAVNHIDYIINGDTEKRKTVKSSDNCCRYELRLQERLENLSIPFL